MEFAVCGQFVAAVVSSATIVVGIGFPMLLDQKPSATEEA